MKTIKVLLVVIAAALIGINVQMFRTSPQAAAKPMVESQIVEVLGRYEIPHPHSNASTAPYLVRDSHGVIRSVRPNYSLSRDVKFLLETGEGRYMPFYAVGQTEL
jgi:hypothetical protein